MGSKARFGTAAAALTVILAGCGEGDLPGHYWDVELSLLEDACNASPVGYNESLEYRVVYDLDDIEVAVGPDVFAVGTSSGCEVSYSTITWTEPREAAHAPMHHIHKSSPLQAQQLELRVPGRFE